MDVKRLQAVNDDGLEQWKPVLKAPNRWPRRTVAEVMAALATEVPALARAEYTLDELLAELVEPNPDLLAVAVHKRREHYTVGGCLAELTELRTEQGARRTIAVEWEDAALVSRGGVRARPGRAPERVPPTRAEGARRVRGEALRGDRCRHELRQVPHRRA